MPWTLWTNWVWRVRREDVPTTASRWVWWARKEMAKYEKLVPSHAEGYYLSVEPKGAVVVGRDERGLYYGVQTLREMMAKGQNGNCTAQDWPDVAYRGAIEGFYGRPWSHEHRLRQLDFYGHNKLNVYIYGPKDDPYHRPTLARPLS